MSTHSIWKRMAVLILLCSTFVAPVLSQAPERVIFKVDWSADGTRIAVTERAGITIYDRSFSPLVFRPFPDDIYYEIYPATFNPDGTRLLMNNEILDSATLETIMTIYDYILGYSGQWSPDGTEIAFIRGDERGLRIYDAKTGTFKREFSGIEWAGGAEAGPYWSPDGQYFVRNSGRNGIYLIDAVTGTLIARHEVNMYFIFEPLWSPDSTRLATQGERLGPLEARGSENPTIIILDALTGEELSSIRIEHNVGRMTWSPDSQQISGFQQDVVTTWETSTGNVISQLSVPTNLLSELRYSEYAAQLNIASVVVTSNLAQNNNQALEEFRNPALVQQIGQGGIMTTIVPIATPERFAEIAVSCGAPATLAETNATLQAQSADAQSQSLLAQLDALPADAISAGCAADLRAIAEAIGAQ